MTRISISCREKIADKMMFLSAWKVFFNRSGFENLH
jgi:hypothetical protein